MHIHYTYLHIHIVHTYVLYVCTYKHTVDQEDFVVKKVTWDKSSTRFNFRKHSMYELGLSDSENNTITIVKTVVFTIVNTITIVGLSIHLNHDYKQKGINLSSIAHGLEYRSCFIYFMKLLPVQLINIPSIYYKFTNSNSLAAYYLIHEYCQTITIVNTITIIAQP